ncbi:TauD/TfdA family dioxygenase [Streptomyces sp. NPDC058667]|uniref:TauD/TfdA family dioxygenase n=1 Tax=Streptomyces sp. NPDC058667 TaxID=3346588 RepID=UPI003649EA2A
MEEASGAAERRRWDRDWDRDRAMPGDGDWLISLPPSGRGGRAGSAEGADPVDMPATPATPSSESALSAEETRRVLSALSDGPGFAVLRGLAVEGLTDQACADLCRSVISVTGSPRPRESAAPMDDLLTTPRAPSSAPAVGEGSSRAGVEVAALAPHTDRAGPPGPPRFLALLCVRPAPAGGETVLISGHSLHQRLMDCRPAVLPELYRDFRFGAEPVLARTAPVFTRTGTRITVQYNRYQIERGHQAARRPLTPAQTDALDAFDEALSDQAPLLHLQLRRGDLLLLNNHTVLHGRTAYTDPHRQRCLTRAWAD